MRPNWRVSLVLLVALSLLASCLPIEETSAPPPWRYTDLRLLSAPGTGQDSHQLVSLYTRRFHSDLQIRLDLLSYDPQDEFDLYLAVDSHPGGERRLPIDAQAGFDWDLLLIIPSSGPLVALEPGEEVRKGLRMRVVRNPALDTLTVSLDKNVAGKSFRIQAFLTESGSPQPVSSLGPVRSDAQPPPRLPVTIAFWNTFPAYTPSQALRRLDGAHTGPSSDRHGLRGLMDAVESSRFPVLLLDIKTPTTLSALDYTGALDRVRKLASQDLLILPDTTPFLLQPGLLDGPLSSLFPKFTIQSSQLMKAFDLKPNTILYTTTHPGAWSADNQKELGQHRLILSNPALPALPTYDQEYFTVQEDNLSAGESYSLSPFVSRWQASTLVDFSSLSRVLLQSDQATYSGPSMEIRRVLLQTASDPDGRPFVVMGGDFSQTSWGNPTAATQTLNYLRSRPWIRPMSSAELVAVTPRRSSGKAFDPTQAYWRMGTESFTPTSTDATGFSYGLTIDQVPALLSEELKRAPDNTASALAWQAFEALLAPPILPHPSLASLRANYFGQIGHLLAASRWEDSDLQAFCPSSSGTGGICFAAQDLDWDGEKEYIMASQDIFLLFESRGGYLSYAFWRGSDGVHQVIAPSSQFIVGMGDPMIWDPAKGVAGDPAQYRGAFSEIPAGFSTPSWEDYDVEISAESLSFSAPDGSLQKIFSFSPTGFTASYRTGAPLTVQIPLAIDPALRFIPGWGNQYTDNKLTQGWLWGLKDGVQVQVLSSEEMLFSAFSDSYEYMSQPEDPDFDFPSGHFLPFPMALIEISAAGEFTIEISMIAP